jgi:hypothetical protein
VKVFKLLLQGVDENSNLSLQLDPVEDRSRNPTLVFHYGPWRAYGRPHRVARTAARVHRSDEPASSGKLKWRVNRHEREYVHPVGLCLSLLAIYHPDHEIDHLIAQDH